MTRDTFHTILRSCPGLQEKAGAFRAQSEQKLTVYLGGDGRGLVVSQIEEVKLEDAHVVLKTKEPGAVFADYAAIYAVSAQPPKEGAPKKAGFA